MRHCYITEAEIFTPFGIGLAHNFNQMKSGSSALQIKDFKSAKKPVYCASIPDHLVAERNSETFKKKYTRLEKICISTIQNLLKETDLDIRSGNTIMVFCTTKGNIEILFHPDPDIPKERLLFSECANAIAKHFGMSNDPIVVSNACISGVEGLIIGKHLVSSAIYNNVIVVAADLVTEFTISGFCSLNAYARGKCKPFDKKRTGINLGECCAAMVLQAEADKQKQSYRVVRAASTNDAHHMTAPARDARGLIQAIMQCLGDDNQPPDFISAHGTGTRYNDTMEALAFLKTGLHEVPFYSLKGYLGHTLGAAGLVETAIALKSLEEGLILASLGFEEPELGTSLTPQKIVLRKTAKNFIKTASGFGGGNACVFIEKV